MEQYLENTLYSDVEGTCSGAHGYIIAVLSILDIGHGSIQTGTGQAEFITRYRAIVFKPFRGEVVDGIVGEVNKVSGIAHYVAYGGTDAYCWVHRWASLRMLDL